MKSITQLAATFAFQSYFDSVLLHNAILAQTNGNPIVDSTRQHAQTPGVGVALHPSSQSPVAIRFDGGTSGSAVIHLTPGQKFFPGDFRGFEWGLPFGWLGGGPVLLYVLSSKDADVQFPQADSPIIFHRLRVVIESGASGPIAIPSAAGQNWPIAFPWGNALRGIVAGVGPTPQRAAPLFQIEPEFVLLSLTSSIGVAPGLDCVIQISNPDAFSLHSPPDQAVGYSNTAQFWPIHLPSVPIGAGPSQVVTIPPEIARLGGDAAEFHLIEATGDWAGLFVDVVRYGRFM